MVRSASVAFLALWLNDCAGARLVKICGGPTEVVPVSSLQSHYCTDQDGFSKIAEKLAACDAQDQP
jgi:hypothetical protein